jgi:hypothetical protein
VARYPPEADFLVSSEKHPEQVTHYPDYVKRRQVYDQATVGIKGMRPWPTVE